MNRKTPISIVRTIVGVAKGVSAILAIAINTIVLSTTLFVLAIGKFIAPTEKLRGHVRHACGRLAELWIGINNRIFSLYRGTHWDIQLPEGLDKKGSYLVSCNHQSWVDILVLQRCFNRRLPFFRFFIKSQLIWVPFLGQAWWALDMPFMRRDSKEKLARKPGRKGRDLESARKACEKFRDIPVAMTNFPEGTRFTLEKRDRLNSPYRNLLPPRIGGIGQVFFALADKLDALIDVTIVYPQARKEGQAPTFWQLVSGQVSEIIVRAEKRAIPAELLGRNFRTDKEFRQELTNWIGQMWREKDALIDRLNPAEATAAEAG